MARSAASVRVAGSRAPAVNRPWTIAARRALITTRTRSASTALPLLAGATGMAFVGGSVAVSGELAGAPMFTVQALRYAVACLLLLGYARLRGTRPVAPVTAALTGVALGGPAPQLPVWAGVATVAAGLAIGFSRDRRPRGTAEQPPYAGISTGPPAAAGTR